MIAPVEGSGSCPAWMQTVEKRAVFGSFTGHQSGCVNGERAERKA
jgi:hypothetical protein